MKWIKNNGYAVTLHDNHAGATRRVAPTKNVIFTFDDGEMNNYFRAFPVLQEYGFPAFFFVIAKRIGHEGYMGWNELKQLHAAGMVIGSHGFSHAILTNLKDTQIEEELAASKKYLERNLEIGVNSLSIPRGFCNDKIIRMARQSGYQNIFISERPKHLKEACLCRTAVKGNWTLERFKQALEGTVPAKEILFDASKNTVKKIFGGAGYDWVRRMLLKIK